MQKAPNRFQIVPTRSANPRHDLPPASPDPARGPAATPIVFIRAIVLAYRRYRADPTNALAQARIPPEALLDPEARVTAAQMEIISSVAMQELDDEALGWYSRKLPWGSYGMLCRASLTSPNLGVAVKRWCRHHRLLIDDIVFTLTTSGSVARIAITEHRDLGELREFCLISSLRYLLGFACWVIDSRIPLLEARLPFPQPAHHGVYPLLFPGPIHFDAEQAGFSFDAQYLALPLRRDEQALRQMLQRALPLTVRQYRHDRLLGQRVRQLLGAQTDEAATADMLARRLHVSVRTLHRHLQEEGSSLQQVKDEARRDRAMELLTRTARPIKQVAQAVGFSNERSFARAFRQWTGSTPSEFRDGAVAATVNERKA